MITLLNGEEWEEKRILENMVNDGFYYGHLGQNALSSSAAKKLLESPKAYKKSLYYSTETQPLRDGRLVHLSVLEPHRINDLTIVEGTKASKAFKDAVKDLGSELVYTQSEMDNAYWISKAVRECPDAANLLDGCTFEEPAIKMIEGIAFRGKADARKGKTIIDLKTTSSSKTKKSHETLAESFRYTAKNFSYDLQAALYLELFDADEFIFLVVDKDTKDVAICDCSARFIYDGQHKLESAIGTYKHFFLNNDPKESLKNYVTYHTL